MRIKLFLVQKLRMTKACCTRDLLFEKLFLFLRNFFFLLIPRSDILSFSWIEIIFSVPNCYVNFSIFFYSSKNAFLYEMIFFTLFFIFLFVSRTFFSLLAVLKENVKLKSNLCTCALKFSMNLN